MLRLVDFLEIVFFSESSKVFSVKVFYELRQKIFGV
jgi:hypothetical protein